MSPPRPAALAPWVVAALLLGLSGLLFPAQPQMPPLWKILFLAFAEELIFRIGLQAYLEKKITLRAGPISAGNLAASVVFALLHLPTAPFWQACAILFPSLLLGILWTRSSSLLLCGAIHAYFNILFYL